ncbi:methyltransferase domain-containing protein [Lentinula raphanica]|uniref:Methyltransferase domain-containing protein n=1 Tax=Lentinula raphanica TaxID=153919 RepID=A0AA38NY69_9AGAR|nr:methyltransferase domain-containing protein [Lentinula raphanica]KAJ3832809.1 methyltransferase domain-containing protein [Lentinula raphanica]
MPGSTLQVFLRHPRYAMLLLLVLVPSIYLLLPFRPDPPLIPLRIAPNELTDVAYRMAQAEALYQKTILDRTGLISRYGPHPSDIDMFPPNKSPWPAYTVWDYFPASFNCPYEVRRVGSLSDGGKWVCGLSRLVDKKDCVIYSVGINHESSFEADLLVNTNYCKVWGYDASVKGFAKQIPYTERYRTTFHRYALGHVDRPASGSESVMYTLKTLMQMNGHQHIDILKVDLEGWEFDAITNMIKSFVTQDLPLPFGQLLLEIHVWDKNFEYLLKWWEGLEEAGLRPFWNAPNLVYVNYAGSRKPELAEYSFLNIKDGNVFIT